MAFVRTNALKTGVILSSLGLLFLAGCKEDTKETAAPPPSVSVAAVVSKDVRQNANYVGQVAAIDKVGLVARVSGFLEEKLVPDGSVVKKGDLVFKIEKDQYKAAVQKAEADLASAKADEALKAADEKRDKDLLQKGHVSEAAYEATLAQMQQAEASVAAAHAALASSELDLSYTDVTAPFPGQIGKTTYSVGEVVGPTAEPLASLVSLAPVYVNFSVSEAQYLNAVKTHGIDSAKLDDGATPDLSLILPNGDSLGETGKIVFIDNRVDSRTGTISFRGQFANEDGSLLDGTYVTVNIAAPEQTKALLVPQAAIQRDQKGSFVLAISKEETVEQRYVDLGDQVEGEFIVKSGLQEGERVIVQGLQKVRPGVPVNAVLASKPAE